MEDGDGKKGEGGEEETRRQTGGGMYMYGLTDEMLEG